MNKTQLIDAVAEKAGLSKMDSKKAVEALVESIREALRNEERVALVGLGTFAVLENEARTGRNPRTGAVVDIPEKKVVKFRAGRGLMSE